MSENKVFRSNFWEKRVQFFVHVAYLRERESAKKVGVKKLSLSERQFLSFWSRAAFWQQFLNFNSYLDIFRLII